MAIAGVPGLAGFFSKDEILGQTYATGHTTLWVIGILTAMLTATYMFRLVFMAFHGQPRYALAGGGHGHDAHDDRGPSPVAHIEQVMTCFITRGTVPIICTTHRRRWRWR